MARITASVYTSHVPAIGAAFDLGKSQDPYWKPVFDGFEWVQEFQRKEDPDVVILCYNDHASAMMLEVEHTNAAAIELYQALGYMQISVRMNYYGAGNDALVMRKEFA